MCKDEGWCSGRQAERYIERARKQFIKESTEDTEYRRLMKLKELEDLYESMAEPYRNTPDGIKQLLAIRRTQILLMGLQVPPKLQIEATVDHNHTHTVEVDYTLLDTDTLKKIAAARKKPVYEISAPTNKP